ncbi:PepSY-associated TM helix domain-containing protein [Actinoplanes sp. G11-F43]|uniref:PepSY-associated TM helix domain-containing protein n=1 Tax=Actinoplanes sp. G11-F43 TaxID=3424130 RepID=UPI003D325FEF
MAVSTDVSTPVPTVRTAGRRSFGPLLLRLHFYAGILVAPFILIAASTGFLFTLVPTLDKIVYSSELTVATTGDATLPVARQIDAARAAHPDGDLIAVRVGEGDATTQVDFSHPSNPDLAHTVYVDPYTGDPAGQLTTWWGATPLNTWLDQFHRDLHLGPTGELYSEFAASWLWILALGGVILWWRRQRGRRTAKSLLAPDLAAKKGVRRTRSWHAALGVWLAAGMLILSATGLTWSGYAGANFAAALDELKGNRPYVTTTLDGTAAASSGGHHGSSAAAAPVDPAAVDTVLATARGAGLDGPLAITPPADTASAWTVTQNDNVWPVRLDSLAVDSTGAVVDRVDFADWPFLAKLTSWGINAHMGLLFGPANQIVLAALALGLITLIVWGYRMWWQRRPTRAGRRAPVGTPPVGPGAWQQLPTWGIVVGVPLVFGLAWALPLFGLPLAAFLLVDLLISVVRKRRTPPRVPVSPAPAGS